MPAVQTNASTVTPSANAPPFPPFTGKLPPDVVTLSSFAGQPFQLQPDNVFNDIYGEKDIFSITSGQYEGGVVLATNDRKFVFPPAVLNTTNPVARAFFDRLGIKAQLAKPEAEPAKAAASAVPNLGFRDLRLRGKSERSDQRRHGVAARQKSEGPRYLSRGSGRGLSKDIVDPSETAGINENTASIFALGPRSAALGRKLAAPADASPAKFEYAKPEAIRVSFPNETMAQPLQLKLDKPAGAEVRRETNEERIARRSSPSESIARSTTSTTLDSSSQLRVRALVADALSDFSFRIRRRHRLPSPSRNSSRT